MAQSMQNIKRRIRSIQSTMKITNAMELVATSKLQKEKTRMEHNKEYANCLYETMSKILASSDQFDNVFLRKPEVDKPLVIIVTSDTGLCGAYNTNILRFAEENLQGNEDLIVIGTKGINWARRNGKEVMHVYNSFEKVTFAQTSVIANIAMDLYRKEEISQIRVLYAEYVNSMDFDPTSLVILPVEETEKRLDKEILFEPNANSILDELIPMYVRNMLYSTIIRAKTSEYASRRLAMENATDNAEELTDELMLEYNQARQGAITQEITEIITGAEAL
jgi:ATP synthase, F1 gamma subunit